jgi:transposase
MNLIKERRPKMYISNNKKGIDINQYDNYLSIDWSQDKVAIARMKRNSSEPHVIEMDPPELKKVKEYLSEIKGRKVLTIEETTSTHWLYVELKETVDRILICDPYINKLLQTGPKTDKLDARALCKLLRANMLREVYHSLDEDYIIRKLSSNYDDLVKLGVRIKNQQSALYRAEGLNYKKDGLPDKPILKFIEQKQNGVIELYERDRKDYQKYFRKIISQNPQIRNLLKIPGIGEVFAVTIYAIVIQAERFMDKYKYWSYCGLALNKKESGKRQYGKRKPRYSRKLRGVYISAAKSAIGGHNDLAEYYNELIESGLPDKVAKKSIARYIAKVSLGMLKTKGQYVPYRWRNTKEKEIVK